jgi:cobalt-zinc-cadmium efflux system protein
VPGGHHHDHDHDHHRPHAADRRLAIAIGANGALLVAQIVVGIAAGSLSLLADSIHNASDVVALVLALAALRLARRAPDPRRSYGFARAEIVAALANSAVLGALTVLVIVEAIHRFAAPTDLRPGPTAVIGLLGMLVNGISAALFHRETSLNLRAAFWHLASDALGSLAVVVAAAAIWIAEARWADPVASIVISMLVLVGVWGVLRDATEVLLETAPSSIDPDDVRAELAGVSGVEDAHHLHIWTIGSGQVALTAHLTLAGDTDLHGAQTVSERCRALLAERFGIRHTTLETECHPCDEPDHRPHADRT